jgi:WD40 repeat protein
MSLRDAESGVLNLFPDGPDRANARLDDASIQTEELLSVDASSQTAYRESEATQTHAQSSSEGLSEDWDAPLPADVGAWLRRVAPIMEEELEAALSSKAFEGYDQQLQLLEGRDGGLSVDSESRVWCELAPGLEKLLVMNPPHPQRPLQCTGLSWNATGSTLVAVFGRTDISGWCEEPGALCIWNVFRRDFDASLPPPPEKLIEHGSCLMSVACHPEQPALVAAGSFNGEVLVWDLASSEDVLIASTCVDDYFHREPVTAVAWVRQSTLTGGSGRSDPSGGTFLLASVSGDGKVLFWSLDNGLGYPVSGYRLTVPPGTSGKRSLAAPRAMGGTSLSFPAEGRVVSSMVVGSEGGNIVRCLLSAAPSQFTLGGGSTLEWSPDAAALLGRADQADRDKIRVAVERAVKDARGREVNLGDVYRAGVDAASLLATPKVSYFERHEGSVNSVDCSPFHRGVFLTCGGDGSTKVFSTLQRSPLLTFDASVTENAARVAVPGVLDAAWSRTRPLVFAAATSDGDVHVYDLAQSSTLPSARLANSSEGGSEACCSLSFNPKQRDFLAAGYARGAIRIWRLSWRLSNPFPGEETALQELYEKSRRDDGEGEPMAPP